MGEFDHLLDSNARVPQDLYERPRHEGAGDEPLGIESLRLPILQDVEVGRLGLPLDHSGVLFAIEGEGRVCWCGFRYFAQSDGILIPLLSRGDERVEHLSNDTPRIAATERARR